jgi:hypothetical protein
LCIQHALFSAFGHNHSTSWAMAEPDAKRAKTASLVDLSTARAWNHGDHIFGLHAGVSAAHLRVAQTLLKDHGYLHCYDCGARVVVHKTTWQNHYDSKACEDKRANPINRFNPAVLAFAASSAPRARVDEVRARRLLVSSLAACGIAPAQQALILQRGAPELTALASFTSTGLPASHTTISADVSGGAEIIRKERIAPELRRAITAQVPLAVLADESSTKRMVGKANVMQVWAYSPLMTAPLPVDVVIMEGGTAVQIRSAIRESIVRDGWLSAAEFDSSVKTFSSDHAKAMIRAGKDMGMVTTGDPPHAIELVVKKLLMKLGLRPLLMQFRRIFTRKNSVAHRRLLEAYGIPHNIFEM